MVGALHLGGDLKGGGITGSASLDKAGQFTAALTSGSGNLVELSPTTGDVNLREV